MIVLAVGVTGCGGSSKTTTPASTNAAAGNYTATITAVGSGITHTLVVKVVVK
jgi:PKD repeat protein